MSPLQHGFTATTTTGSAQSPTATPATPATHPTPAPYRGGARMAWRRQQIQDAGAKVAEALEAAYHAAHQMSLVMPTWSDITATQDIALGERCVVWGLMEAYHQDLISLIKDLQSLRASGPWAANLHQSIPTAWDTRASLLMLEHPRHFGLTDDQAKALQAERADAFDRLLEVTRRLGEPVTLTVQPAAVPDEEVL